MYKKLFLWGLVSSLAFAPFYLFPIFFFSLNYLLNCIEKTDKNQFWIGWFFGFGYFIGNCYWYCHSLLMWPYYFLIPLAITIIPAFLACYIGLTTFFTKKFINESKFLTTIIFSALWVFFEYLRGIILTGFPWNLLCYCLGFSPLLIQTVNIYGCYIFSFILLTIFTIFYVKPKRYMYTYYILILIFIISYGFFRMSSKDSANFDNFKIVKTDIKTNTTMSNKEIIDNLINKTLSSSIEDIDYIIWPEAAIPSLVTKNDNILKYVSSKLKDKTLIVGAVRFENNKIYNSVLIVKNGKIIDYYDKYKLVPFGEYIPLRKIFPFINALTTTVDISKGKEKQKIININNWKISLLICYESIFPSLVNKKANLIVNITNDAWFGKTSGPYQHTVALRFRAVENNIPAIRVSNGGLSIIFDKNGRIIDKK